MHISERARLEIKKKANFLVVLVDVGGCKGFVYEYFYTNEQNNYVLLSDVVLTDEYSLPFLLDIKLDFVSDIGHEDFVITNDEFFNNKRSMCGCGKSFTK